MSRSITSSQGILTTGFDEIGSEVKVEHETIDENHDCTLLAYHDSQGQQNENSGLELEEFNGDHLQIQTPSIDEEIDIKYELSSIERNGMGHAEVDVDMEIDPDGRFTKTDPNPGSHQTMNTEQKEFQELYRDLVHCDRDCEICLVYIRRLSEHIRATHVGGRVGQVADPLIIDPDDLNMDQSSAIGVKQEEEEGEDVRMERAYSTEESESNAESDSDPDFNIDSESEPDVRNSPLPGSSSTTRVLRRKVGEFNTSKKVIPENTLSQGTEIQIVEKKFSCETCGKICMSQVGLALHKSTHTGRSDPKTKTPKAKSQRKKPEFSKSTPPANLHSCKMCGKKFSSQTELYRHESSVHTKTIEEGPTRQTRSLRTRQIIPGGEGQFKCNMCVKSFTKSVDLTKHKKVHSEGKYKCSECGLRFSRHEGLSAHAHSKKHATQTRCACHYCTCGQVSKSHTFSHWRIPTGGFKCDECEESFQRIFDLNDHKKVHSKDKPYRCHECGERFSSYKALRVHSGKHTVQTGCACRYCTRDQVSECQEFVHWEK